MNTRKQMFALSSGLLLSVVGAVHADTTDTALKSEVAAMKARIAELEGQKSESWLNERRAEEVKALVREVLADADTRASLQGSGAVAGHNGKNFFLASEDGNYLLTVGGQIQVRYVYNMRDDANEDNEDNEADDNENGFTIRRAKLAFAGHIGSPKIQYMIRLKADRSDETVRTEVVKVGYQLTDNISIWAGEDKAPFLREELISSGRQLAVERSYLNAVNSLGYVQGIWVNWEASDMIKTSVAIHDGSRSGEGYGSDSDSDGSNKDFYGDNTDVAIGGRIDVKLMGDWSSWNDFSSWSGEDPSLIIGGAINWDVTETGDDISSHNNNDSVLAWTVDASFKTAGFNAFAAYVWNEALNDEISNNENVEIHSYLVQAGYMVIPDKLEPFVRYEWIEYDDPSVTNDEINILTFGANYYIKKHDAKFTLDVVYAMDPISGASGLGLLSDSDNDDQIAIRAQFQLLF